MAKIKIHIDDLFNIPSAEIFNPDGYKTANGVSIDTRTLKKNNIFVAIKGDKFDGHKFVLQAVENGASAVIVNKRYLKKLDDVAIPIITVKDTTIALGNLASIIRKKYNFKVIGITGSNGKTSTKDYIATLLSERYNVVKTFSNNNNHIGVPLTIFSANTNTEYIVLEIGTNHFGEIDYTSKIAKPNFSVITNIGDSHTEYLLDKEGVLKEKSAIYTHTLDTIFINNDDKLTKAYSKNIENKVAFGFKGKPDVKGKIVGYSQYGNPVIEITATKNFRVELPIYGVSNAKNYLTAVAIAISAGLTKKQIIDGTKKLNPAKGRLDVKKIGSTILIDDTYNANPESMAAGFDLLNKIKAAKKRIAVLGDMLELGSKSKELHTALAASVKKNRINEVLLIGKEMKHLADELGEKALYFKTRNLLSNYLNKIDLTDSAVLVKGSRGMKMEEFLITINERL